MAKRKQAYGYTPAEHKEGARIYTVAARSRANSLRASLRIGDCNQAVQDLGALNRAVGKAMMHRSAWKKQISMPWSVAVSLEGKFYRKCVLKRKSYRSPR